MEAPVDQRPRRAGPWLLGMVAGTLVVFTLGAMLVSGISQVREAARKARCLGQLKMFMLSMHAHHDRHGDFPPAYIADRDGKPQHSWRILLSEHYGDPTFKQYDFHQPWDNAANRALSKGLRVGMSGGYPTYHCQSDADSDLFDTNYVMVVGSGTLSAGTNTIRISDVKDGTSTTIGVVEMAASGITWMAPRDLKFDEMSFTVNDFATPCPRSTHGGTVNVGYLDGNAGSLRADIDPDVLRGLPTIAGGEPWPAEIFP